MSIEQILSSLPEQSAKACERIRQNALRLQQMGTPSQKADAARLLVALAQLDQPSDPTPFEELPQDEITRRIARAFKRRPATETDALVIRVLLDNPAKTSSQLSALCGWRGVSWHNHFGKMCGLRLPDLWPAGEVESWGKPFQTGLFAKFDRTGATFTMRPEVAVGLQALGYVAKPNLSRVANEPAP